MITLLNISWQYCCYVCTPPQLSLKCSHQNDLLWIQLSIPRVGSPALFVNHLCYMFVFVMSKTLPSWAWDCCQTVEIKKINLRMHKWVWHAGDAFKDLDLTTNYQKNVIIVRTILFQYNCADFTLITSSFGLVWCCILF